MTDKMFTSEIVSLKSLRNLSFSVPTYQRPYVWGEEQLKKLLDDFHHSFTKDPNEVYYLSTFLTKDNNNDAELIDGQQRFTSLWLIAFVLNDLLKKRDQNSEILQFLKKDKSLRLSFEIRNEVSKFLEQLMDDEKVSQQIFDEEFITNQPYLKNIAAALVFISGYIRQLNLNDQDLKKFGDYIFTNIQLIKNTTPLNTDLNKLFSNINSTGVQLEQTDIIKAKLLRKIDDKVLYSKIWEASENMNNFFERNVRESFPESNWKEIDFSSFSGFDRNLFRYLNEETAQEGENSSFSIDDLNLNDILPYSAPVKQHSDEKRESEEIYCRSIINFGQLLLHTYRIHLQREGFDDFEGTFHVSRLIEIFENLEKKEDQEEIKRFFELLWDVRYIFDKYVVKWITDTDTKKETLELVNFNRNQEYYYSRTKYEKSSSLMLQSVLYFTGDYQRQYWLTSYIGFLLKNHFDRPATDRDILAYLEEMDNLFSINNDLTDKEVSWLLLKGNDGLKQHVNFEAYLNTDLGTAFKHYWFQKLDYIIWKNWAFEKTEEFKNYRITSKNSIEHIYPQNPENILHHPQIPDKYLHSFGNLVLLSVAQNSEYSNKAVRVKKSMFYEKRDTYDSLKSYYIFNHYENWSTFEIIDHKEKMIKMIKEHYA